VRVFVAATASGYSQLAGLLAEYEADLPPELRHSDSEYERTNAALVYAEPNVALVAEIDGSPCGCVALMRHDESTGIVRHLYVRPPSREHGIGRALMSALIERARERGYKHIMLDTHREQLGPAYRLYRAFGFAEREPFGNVDYRCPTFMELAL
jgi:putative acetyltransferase